MKRIIIIANPESIRAFRLGSRMAKDRIEFVVAEIDMPQESDARQQSPDLDQRFEEMACLIDGLVASEKPESWVMTAPLSTLARLLPTLKPSVKNRLGDVKIGDLTALPANRVAHQFAPASVAA